MNKRQKRTLVRILVSAVLLVVILLLPVSDPVRSLLGLIPYFVIGYDILLRAGKGIWHRQVFDENFLMAVATVGALALGEVAEGVAVMLFYQIGELFQSYAVARSRRNISELMDIRPDYANVEGEDGTITRTDPDEVEIGSVIVVAPGEKIPIDGVILEGMSTLDTSALTGESMPRKAAPDDEVISGCVNMTGLLKIRTEKEFGESTASKILEMVENASSRKSRSENFISRFARIYTPAVCLAALLLAVLPPCIRMLFFDLSPMWSEWVMRALTFLVISCPCALVISIPLGFFAGIGGASHAGILVKGSNYLEALSKAGIVAFDKTGTLTEGNFAVSGIEHNRIPEEDLLFYAAHAECFSTHPISRSLASAYGKEVSAPAVSKVEEVGGEGVTALVAGHVVACGNEKLMKRLQIPYEKADGFGTIVYVALDGSFAGSVRIEDQIRKTSKEAVEKLKKCGVRKIVLLTGDRPESADYVARQLGITEVHDELLPVDKVNCIEQLIADKKKKESVIFVGDGVNDAPVLARSDVGIAMGAFGSEAAIEAADIVLMDDDPLKVAKAVRIAGKCMRIVHENIVFAIGVKVICLILGAFGIAGMWLAIFADVGVMVIAVCNAIRSLYTKRC